MSNQKLVKCKPGEVARSLTNPRGADFTKRPDWPEFIESVRMYGVKQPPLVRPLPASRKDAKGALYELIAGDRRTTAAQELKLPEMSVLVEDLSDAQAYEIQQIENLQRSDLTPLEEAQGYATWRDKLIADKTVKTVDEAVLHICGKVAKKKTAVYSKLALLKLPSAARKALETGELETSKASLVATVPGPAQQEKFFKEITEDRKWNQGVMSYREAQEHLEENYRVSLKDAPFDQNEVFSATDVKDSTILQTPGQTLLKCGECPYNTSCMMKQNAELKVTANICTNPACYRLKVAKNTDALLNRARAEKKPVLTLEEYKRTRGACDTISDRCYEDSKDRTWGTLAKLAGVTPRLAVNDGGGTVEVVTAEDKTKIKTELKLRSSSNYGGGYKKSEADKNREKKEKRMKLVAGEASALVLSALVKPSPVPGSDGAAIPSKLWAMLSKSAYDETNIETHDFVAKRRGLSESINESRDAMQKWFKQPHTPMEHAAMLLDLLLCAGWSGTSWSGPLKWDGQFLDLCKLAKVDVEKMQKEADEASANPTKKPKQGLLLEVKGSNQFEHKWQKTDLVSGVRTNYRCAKCGLKAVRNGLVWPPLVTQKNQFCKIADAPVASAPAKKPAAAKKVAKKK